MTVVDAAPKREERVDLPPPKKAVGYKVPHKALPDTPGRVIQFHHRVAVEEIGIFMQYVAHELMATDLAVKEAGFPQSPSVLIIAADCFPNARNFYKRDLHKDLRVEADYWNSQYGVSYKNGFSVNRTEGRYFLHDIYVDKESGLHYYTGANSANVMTVIDEAKKFFDLVFVSPTLNISHEAYPFDQVYVTNRKVKGDNVTYVENNVMSTQGSKYMSMRRKKDEFILHFDRSRSGTYEHVRAQATDMARRILGVTDNTVSWDVIPHPKGLSHVVNKMGTRILDSQDDAIGGVFTGSPLFVLVGILASTFTVPPFAEALDIPPITEPILLAFFAPLVVLLPFALVATPASIDRLVFSIPRKKRFTRSIKENFPLYEKRPVHQTAMTSGK